MSDTGRNDGKGDVQERSWILDSWEDAELEGEMNVFEVIGIAFMALGVGMFVLIGIVALLSRFIK